MGRGVAFPHSDGAEQIIVDVPFFDDDEYGEEKSLWFDDLRYRVKHTLPDSFYFDDGVGCFCWEWSSCLLKVSLHGEDTLAHIYIEAQEQDEFQHHKNLAWNHLDNLYKKIGKKLQDYGYELRQRTSSWTTGHLDF